MNHQDLMVVMVDRNEEADQRYCCIDVDFVLQPAPEAENDVELEPLEGHAEEAEQELELQQQEG